MFLSYCSLHLTGTGPPYRVVFRVKFYPGDPVSLYEKLTYFPYPSLTFFLAFISAQASFTSRIYASLLLLTPYRNRTSIPSSLQGQVLPRILLRPPACMKRSPTCKFQFPSLTPLLAFISSQASFTSRIYASLLLTPYRNRTSIPSSLQGQVLPRGPLLLEGRDHPLPALSAAQERPAPWPAGGLLPR